MKEKEARSNLSEHLHLSSTAPFFAIPSTAFFPLVSISTASPTRTWHLGSFSSTPPGQATSFGPQQLHTPPSLSQPVTLHCTLPPTHKISQGKLSVSSHADEFPWGDNQTHTPRQPGGTQLSMATCARSQSNYFTTSVQCPGVFTTKFPS